MSWEASEETLKEGLEQFIYQQDEEGNALPLTVLEIEEAYDWLVKYCEIPLDDCTPPSFAIQQYQSSKKGAPSPAIINSFLLEDIQRAKHSIQSGTANPALCAYLGITKPKRQHVGPTAHSSEATYHYHASLNFPNLPGCLSGVTVKNNFSTNAKQGIGTAGGPSGPNAAPGGHNQGLPPGFDKAAEVLGVSYEDLSAAIINNGGRDLDLAAAAKALGVTEAALKAALPRPPGH